MTQEGFADSEQEMRKYVRYSVLQSAILVLLMGMSVILGMTLLFWRRGETSIPVLFVSWLIALSLLYISLSQFLKHMRVMRSLKDSGIYYEAVTDFPSAKSFLNDNIRLGSKYMFGKNCCTIIRYADICRVYQEVLSDANSERSRQLVAIDASGNKWILCALDGYDENQPGLSDVLGLMQGRNSRIVVDN